MSKRWIIYLVIFAFVACSTEMYLSVPGFPAMAEHFNTDVGSIQSTLTLNLIAFCIAALVAGCISDSLGRRSVLIAGFSLFCISSIGCTFATSLNLLLLCRFIQGIGASTIWVISYALISDLTEGSETVKYFSLLSAISTMVISISPSLGSLLCKYFNWRATFGFTAALSALGFLALWLHLPETLTSKIQWQPKNILQNYNKLLRSTPYMLHALTPSVLQAPYYIFISSAPFLYMSVLNVSQELYGLHQSVVIAAYSFFAFNIKRLNTMFGEDRMQLIGISMIIISTIIFIPAVKMHLKPYTLTACMAMSLAGMGICFSRIIAGIFQIFPEIRGSASALMMTIRMLCCGLGVWIGSIFYTGNIIDTVKIITILTTVGIILYFATLRSAEPQLAPLKT